MKRAARDGDLRLRGMGLRARFVLSMTVVLTVVLLVASLLRREQLLHKLQGLGIEAVAAVIHREY